jgi:hypothetical protein
MADEKKVDDSKKFDLTKLNSLAVVSLATAVTGFGAVAGVITGHIALAQIKKTGEAGRPAALAGVVLGYVFVGLGIAMAIGGSFMQLRGYDMGHDGFRPDQNGMMGGQFGDHNQGGMMQVDPGQGGILPPVPAPSVTPSTTN